MKETTALTPLAFDGKKHAFRSRLNAIYGSILATLTFLICATQQRKPYELVEKELMSEEDFKILSLLIQ